MMNPSRHTKTIHCSLGIILLIAAFFAVNILLQPSAYAGKYRQKTFQSPDAAVEGLLIALKNDDKKALLTLLGRGGRAMLLSGDPQFDDSARKGFVDKYAESHSLEKNSETQIILKIGNDKWPFPIPIIKTKRGWRFDPAVGAQEMINRRIGRNELMAIDVLKEYTLAQREYAAKDRDDDGILEYAQKIVSDKGQKNGLYWEHSEGEEPSPFGPFVARAVNEGYAPNEKQSSITPFYGYYFKILKRQGKDAKGGEYEYILNSKMVLGFGLLAYPAQYGRSGIMSFMVNQDGVVYEKNLGKDFISEAHKFDTFNPDNTWKKVK